MTKNHLISIIALISVLLNPCFAAQSQVEEKSLAQQTLSELKSAIHKVSNEASYAKSGQFDDDLKEYTRVFKSLGKVGGDLLIKAFSDKETWRGIYHERLKKHGYMRDMNDNLRGYVARTLGVLEYEPALPVLREALSETRKDSDKDQYQKAFYRKVARAINKIEAASIGSQSNLSLTERLVLNTKKRLPVVISDGVVFRSIAIDKKTVNLTYDLSDEDSFSIDYFVSNANKNKDNMMHTLCSEMKQILSDGYDAMYKYMGLNSNVLFSIKVTKASCS